MKYFMARNSDYIWHFPTNMGCARNRMILFRLILLTYIVWCSTAAPQQPEINDQFQPTTEKNNNDTTVQISQNQTGNPDAESRTIHKLYTVLTVQIRKVIATPKVQSVLRNIGTCLVNGAMELVTFYFPAPIIPLLASAAGMLIPFEPVVMLRRQMPVTSYRRAINSAVSGFMNTFDRYRLDDDPYMTQRFNRRFMRGSDEKNT